MLNILATVSPAATPEPVKAMLHPFLAYGLGLVLGLYILRQVRKPSRWLGWPFLHLMNASHSSLTDWGLAHVPVQPDFTILDIGCGGGRTIEKLAAIATGGMAYGIDYAQGSVAASRSHNRAQIRAGRVVIEEASVSKLPFPENKFDLATAIETQYYWPNLVDDMREILRVLKPGGKLLIIAETYKNGKHDKLNQPVMWLLRSSHLSPQDQRDLFLKAGYTSVEISEETNKGWICGVGTKPTRSTDE